MRLEHRCPVRQRFARLVLERSQLSFLPDLDRTRTERNTLPKSAFEIRWNDVVCLECEVGPELAFKDEDRKDRGRRNGIEIMIAQDATRPGEQAASTHDPLADSIVLLLSQRAKSVDRTPPASFSSPHNRQSPSSGIPDTGRP